MATAITHFRQRLNDTLQSQDSEYDDDLAVPEYLGRRDEYDAVYQDDSKVETLPFSMVHNTSSASKIFIPGKDVTVRIVEVERSVTTHPLNPNLYTIEFQHGPFNWTVKKRYKHIQSLHNQLKLFKMSLKINFHVKRSSCRQTLDHNTSNNTEMKKNLPRFPNKPDFLVLHEQLNHRMRALENYLNNLLKVDIYKHHSETISFLQISHLSFVAELGMKGKEGVVLKRAGSGAKTGCNFFGLLESFFCIRFNYICNALCGKWHRRHLIVKDSFIAHIKPNTCTVKSVILIDQAFEVSAGMYSTGLRNGIQIMNLNQHMVIKCWTRRQTKEWLEYIQQLKSTEARAFTQANPHKSFVPFRESTPASWFVDGATYMSAVADAMEHAKEEIFIADWWLSPEIYLKRPAENKDYWRLDNILERKAKEGVKIFVMIYKEVQMALGINSFYSKQRLVEKCPENIKVFRHPDHAKVGVFFWAHHEKIVVVDQTVAFLGGIDLCYGRWDNQEHRLTDLGASNLSTIYLPMKGKDVSTSSKITKTTEEHSHVIVDLVIGANTIIMATTKSLPVVPRKKRKKRKPEAAQVDLYNPMLISPPQGMEYVKCNTPETERRKFLDRAKEKVDRVKNSVHMKKLINMMVSTSDASSDDDDEADHGLQSDDDQKSFDFQKVFDDTPGTKFWLGKDYVNFIVQDFNNLDSPYQDLVDRSTTPRMPWHDIGVMVQDKVALDVARHFIQRWNAIKIDKAKLNPSYPFLLPKSYSNDRAHLPHIRVKSRHDVDCQVLRSVSSWSAGFIEPDTTEQSIHEAYIHAISSAERYIYIENQFFITLATMDCTRVKNRIGETLLKRILRAKREGSVFRVFVMMPLLPAFEGEVGGPTGTALHAITHWNYASISRGKDAIINQLRENGIDDPSEYITFHGLRTHSLLHGTMVTELIYVHSKLMIVDDKTVICGSANINDRSMIATRDSEIAVIIRDREFDEGRMNDMSFPCGKYAGSLRKHLFKEHLGLLWGEDNIDITDIVKKSFYRDVWKQRSERNTAIFEEVFHCIPSDNVTNFAELKLYKKQEPLSSTDPKAAMDLLSQIKGHIVDLPLNFLCKETLKPTASSGVEGMMPTALWT